jgi:hypothetical protein
MSLFFISICWHIYVLHKESALKYMRGAPPTEKAVPRHWFLTQEDHVRFPVTTYFRFACNVLDTAFFPEEGRSTFLWELTELLPDYTASYRRR